MPSTSISLKVAVAQGYIKPLKAGALASLAGKLAATDPDRAERIAQSITDKNTKAGGARRPCRESWQPPTRTARSVRRFHHRRARKGKGARRHRGGAGDHRPQPRGTHRPVDHRQVLDGQGIGEDCGILEQCDRGAWQPGERIAALPVVDPPGLVLASRLRTHLTLSAVAVLSVSPSLTSRTSGPGRRFEREGLHSDLAVPHEKRIGPELVRVIGRLEATHHM